MICIDGEVRHTHSLRGDMIADGHKLLRIRVGQRLEQHAMDDGEHRRDGSDTKRQCKHRDHGEGKAPAQLAKGVLEIL